MHEQSETTQDPKTGRWVNVYGRKTKDAGKVLPGEPEGGYATLDGAVKAARGRSAGHGRADDSIPETFLTRPSEGPKITR